MNMRVLGKCVFTIFTNQYYISKRLAQTLKVDTNKRGFSNL